MAVGAGAVEGMAVSALPSPDFWRGKRVFLTGHTGIKGTWTRLWLAALGAEVFGYALSPDTTPALHTLVGRDDLAGETLADIRDDETLDQALIVANPEIILHLAAQPLVRASYAEPVLTFDVNVMGTVRLLEAARKLPRLAAVLVVTTDKVYANDDGGRVFSEDDSLGGHDPYSASKAAVELVTASYRRSFFASSGPRIATARAGNVLGGGDFAADRLVPDIVRAALAGESLAIRSPSATRPWQHVLDCVCGYLVFAEALASGRTNIACLNFGPPPTVKSFTVGEIATTMQAALGLSTHWEDVSAAAKPHEMQTLGLDPAQAAAILDWHTQLDAATTVEWTARWYAGWRNGASPRAITLDQIHAYTAIRDATL